jgi:hypothetical protein
MIELLILGRSLVQELRATPVERLSNVKSSFTSKSPFSISEERYMWSSKSPLGPMGQIASEGVLVETFNFERGYGLNQLVLLVCYSHSLRF